MSSESEFERRRIEAGQYLRELRKSAKWTSTRLAASTGVHQSRISRIENGLVTPRVSEIEALLDVMSIDGDERAELMRWVESLHSEYASWRLLLPTGRGDQRQDELADLERSCSHIIEFQLSIIPGLLQTPTYGQQMFETWPDVFTPSEIAEATRARLDRQNVLFDQSRRFEFVLAESAFHITHATSDVMAGQCDRIAQVALMPNVDVYVLEFDTRLQRVPVTGFVVFDDKVVHIDTAFGAVVLNAAPDIEQYGKLFDEIKEVSLSGAQAQEKLLAMSRDFAD